MAAGGMQFLQTRRYLQLDGLGPHGIQHQVPTVTGPASSNDCNAWTSQQILMSSSDLLESGGIFVSSPFSKLQMTLEGVCYLQYDRKDSAIVEWNKPRIWSLLKHWLGPWETKHMQLSLVHMG